MPRQALGSNKDYIFMLEKKGNEWLLKHTEPQFAMNDISKRKHPAFRAILRGPLTPIYTSHSIGGLELNEMLSSPKVKFNSVESTIYQGKECVKIAFSYSPDGNARKALTPIFTKAEVVLDPDRLWTVLYSEVWLPESVKVIGEIKYKEQIEKNEAGVPLVSRTNTKVFEAGDKLTTETSNEFSDIRSAIVPEGEFRLPAFGLPEPSLGEKNVPSNPTRWLWLVLGGFIVLFVVFVASLRNKSKLAS